MIYRPFLKKQIFFLHFAGGNSFSYNFLAEQLKADFDLHQLELPGRGKRMSESFLSSKTEAAEDYLKQIKERHNGEKFLIFGHSMGATLGLLVTELLEDEKKTPELLIVSGNAGPGSSDQKKRHLLEKDEFLQELKTIGGMPDEFFEHKDLMDLYIPILKSDFKICEEQAIESVKIETPIIALMGDREDSMSNVENWKNFTNGDFRYKILKGDHFFIHAHKEQIAKLINRCLV